MSEADPKELIPVTIDGHEVHAKSGDTLLNVILNAGLLVETACGGMGSCHLCRVKFEEGLENVPQPERLEERALGNVLVAEGIRLSCQVKIEGTMSVVIFPRRRSKRTK